MAAAKEGSSDRIEEEGSSSDRIEERVLAHKWLASIACAVVAVLVLLPVYAERVAEPADANAGTGCWVVSAYTVNAARPGGGVYREWFQGWDEALEWRSDDAVMAPCCQKDPNRTSLVIPYDESYADKAWQWDAYGPHNVTLHNLWLCEEDDACANCAGDAFAVEAATCAAGRCESRATNGSCACESRAYEDTQGGGGRWACDDVRGCRWRRDFVVGLAGPPQDVMSWWAQDEDFAILYALYLLAVAASAFGVAASLLIRRDFRRSEEAASTTPFRAYLKALVAYFVIQLFANLAAFLGFTTWRCEHHNVQTTRAYDCDCENPNPTVAAIVGGAWEWMSGFRGWCAGDLGSFSRHWQLIYGDELCGSQFSAMTRPCWLHRVVMDRQRHAIEQASRRLRGGRRGDSA